ncbi:MAG: hypothetical protein ACREBQ_09950, partial [Nitrososphaerales archaeon]
MDVSPHITRMPRNGSSFSFFVIFANCSKRLFENVCGLVSSGVYPRRLAAAQHKFRKPSSLGFCYTQFQTDSYRVIQPEKIYYASPLLALEMTTLSEFVYFPDNDKWATWMTRVVAMTNFGGADFGEIHRTVKGLKSGDYDGWHNRWRGMAEYVEGLAREAEKVGHLVTARKSRLRAFMYY